MMTINVLKARMEEMKLAEKASKVVDASVKAVKGSMPVTNRKFEETKEGLIINDLHADLRISRLESALVNAGMMSEEEVDADVTQELVETRKHMIEYEAQMLEEKKAKDLEEAKAKMAQRIEKTKTHVRNITGFFMPNITVVKEEKKEEVVMTEREEALAAELEAANLRAQEMEQQLIVMQEQVNSISNHFKPAPQQEVVQPTGEQPATRRLRGQFADPSESQFDYKAGSEEA
ncbi:hypothetical protein_gp137 [Bacillus phage vB_BceM_WH1]|nr:hypothetical protein_gp137 [Bacillus phage vB_BceM_WH1]